jgi:pantoate--beta-alanine ligase
VSTADPRSDRRRAVLSHALDSAASAADGGLDAVVAAGQASLMGEPHVELVRVSTVDGDTGGALDSGHSGSVRVTIAATVDGVAGSASRTFYVA